MTRPQADPGPAGEPGPAVEPVKLVAAILWADREALGDAVRRARERWGAVDFEGPDRPFDLTDYYEGEMGKGLQRRILSFAPLIAPERIVQVKLEAMEIEDALRGPRGRRVNVDVGYLDFHKLVLASVKFGAPKVHLGRGVYADLACRYSRGRFHPFEWSFADFKGGRYEGDLLEIRRLYKTVHRGGLGGDSSAGEL